LNQSNYAPQYSSQKIFIIDEAHMLSRSAITAMLKTLEETADHVRFMLLTTEIDKIPSPIRSRCFCLALQSVNPKSMSEHLAALDGVKISEDAMDLLVQLSNGSMREVLSLTQQAAMLDSNVNLSVIHEILSFADEVFVAKMAGFLLSGQFVEIFEEITNFTKSKNISLLSFLTQLIQFFQAEIQKAESAKKGPLLRILIDLNKLSVAATKISFFSAMITIGLAEIAYNNRISN